MKKVLTQGKNLWFRCAAFSLLVLSFLAACEPEQYPIATTDEVNMTGYFQQNPEKYSKFLQILERSGTDAFLQAYGAYTIFAPTNEAVDAYLQEEGVTSVEEIDVEELKRMVRFHLIDDTLKTGSFTDGKLPKPTMHGQFIITGAQNTEGVSRITVNRQANLLEANIPVGNGFIHSIDAVLKPASQTIAEMLESDPDYSIFTTALKATGFYDTLNARPRGGAATGQGWYTVLAQTDEVYNKAGINSFSDLKQKYSTTPDPSDRADSLFLYMAYRILNGNKYLADIVGAGSHPTLAPQEVVSSKLKGDSVLINEDIFNGVLEKGSPVNRRLSDNTATNGVLHSVMKDFAIKLRMPVRVYFDVADQPELRVLPTYRKPGSPGVALNAEQIAGITIEGSQTDLSYQTVPAGDGNPRAFYDYLMIDVRIAKVAAITFKTPTLVKGKYKVWMCYRRTAEDGVLTVSFNGKSLQKTFPYAEYYPGGEEGKLAAQGWKRYMPVSGGNSQARLVGTIDVETTDRHDITMRVLIDDHKGALQLDMIQFIPVDEDQLWPKVAEDGSWLYPQN